MRRGKGGEERVSEGRELLKNNANIISKDLTF